MLVDKSIISGFTKKKTDLDRRIATLATKAELKSKQDKTVKLVAFDSSYFYGKYHFEDGIFLPVFKNFRTVANTYKSYCVEVKKIVWWEY